MSILQAIDQKKYYGLEPNIVRDLGGVNFAVRQGEFVVVVGTSGSGKSTLPHMMGGLDTPTSGNVIVKGQELVKKNDEELTVFRRRNIGFVFQNYNLVFGRPAAACRHCALIAKPAIVFVDEPAGNLDSRRSADVLGC